MRFLATIAAVTATVLGLVISPMATSAGAPRAELERAIASLTSRNGPPSAFLDKDTALLPPGLLQHSLWQRLASRLELTGFDHPDIDTQIDYFKSGLFSLRSNLKEAEPFLYFLVDEIDRAGLPLDLALLPLVESAYDPHAKSGQNAVGIWQFIPATAEFFGLTVNDDYDGRKDIIDSTRAAIQYLKKLNHSFDGDWLLAMAAYNTGPSNVRSAITRAKAAGLEPTFWNLRLSTETSNYVPRILAAIRIISSPEQYGLQLPEIDNRKAIETVAAGRPLSFAKVADIIDTSVHHLTRINPGHYKQTIPQGGPYHITVPAGKSRALIAGLTAGKLGPIEGSTVVANVTDSNLKYRVVPDAYLPNGIPVSAFKPYKKYVYQSHVVQRGENLWNISREMGTDVDTLLDWNGRSDKPLQPGDELIVAFIDEESPRDTNLKVLNYRVQAAETLVSISDKFDLSLHELKKWNPALWTKNRVQPGQLIKIPVHSTRPDL